MSWKLTIRPAADRVAKYSGLLRGFERRMRSQITVLMYHRVLEEADCVDYPFPSLVMPRSLFEAQVDWLAEHARVLPVSEALSEVHDASSRSKPLVCLTFDDGYVDNFEIAAPALEARGLRGTFFITAGAVEAQKPLWYDRAAAMWISLGREEILRRVGDGDNTSAPGLPTRAEWIQWLKTLPNDRRIRVMTMLEDDANDEAWSCPLMTKDQVGRLAEQGHEVGSHTLSHPILTSMDADGCRSEIVGAKKLLQEWTRREVAGFCYPNGDFDATVIRLLREAGHVYACTTRMGSNDAATDRFQLRRIDMTPNRVAAADGGFDPLGFRAEISLFRDALRRTARFRGWHIG